MRGVHAAMVRRRRLTALFAVLVTVALVGLSAHACLPEHHHLDGHETVCVAAMAIAGLTILAAYWKRRARASLSLPRFVVALPLSALPAEISAAARAGPRSPVVLRC
jgi:hypothetical protein